LENALLADCQWLLALLAAQMLVQIPLPLVVLTVVLPVLVQLKGRPEESHSRLLAHGSRL
jgi:hypothetical protein